MMKSKFQNILVFLALAVPIIGWAQQDIYLDTSKPIAERSKDLVSKLTLEEKAQLMMNSSPAIERLGVAPYDWWNEALHGVGRAGVSTVFPQAIALAATFDDALVKQVATSISDEARAQYNIASSKNYYNRYNGLTFWTPNVNIFRDPRWGRGQETYGEDPFLTSLMGVAFVEGLQGDDPNYLKTAACAKHFAVHSGPERVRHEFNAQTSMKDLYETYLPAFEALVKADVEAVMCAYNRTNGEPCCASNFLLDEILRNNWGFDGHVVSDCGAVTDFYAKNGHGTVDTEAEAAALAVKSGVNLDCGTEYFALVDAVEQGLIDEATIDDKLAKLLETRFELGMFDPADKNPYSSLGAETINSAKNRALAKDAALKSIVLLKNDGVLPLQNDLAKYYVTGPNASNIEPLIGNYYGVSDNMVTILEGIASAVAPGSQVQYRQGTLLDRKNVNPIDWASGGAKDSDATFYVMGIHGNIEGEEGASIASPDFGDRLDYNIPQNQIDYLQKLKDGNENPVIAIVSGGSPMNLAAVQELADAVMLMWYPGEEGGNAVADIIFGKTAPSGRLPITFPQSLDQLPAYEDYTMEGRTYKYMKKEPLYPFGFGLSYTSFGYSELALSSSKVKRGQPLTVTALVRNEGQSEAEEVVQLYLTDEEASVRTPLFSLIGIQRIALAPGASKKVTFIINPEQMKLVNNQGEKVFEKGKFTVSIGGSLPTQRSLELGAAQFTQSQFTLR
jgi:beta-glucosidase